MRASEDGQTIVIEVADSGGGIAPEDQLKIFEELYRGTNARSTEGSGLGLALVKRIIALHSGQIYMRSSQAEPRGTVFTIRLPVTRTGLKVVRYNIPLLKTRRESEDSRPSVCSYNGLDKLTGVTKL